MIGGILFIIGAALQAGAVHLAMLIVGRIMLGFGVRLSWSAWTPITAWLDHIRTDLKHQSPPCNAAL